MFEMPSNSLILALGPYGRKYCLPTNTKPESRASSPSNGYASDPESELHKMKRFLVEPPERTVEGGLSRRRKGTNDGDAKDKAKTATWPDLFQ